MRILLPYKVTIEDFAGKPVEHCVLCASKACALAAFEELKERYGRIGGVRISVFKIEYTRNYVYSLWEDDSVLIEHITVPRKSKMPCI